jgi:hypothetical protein
VEKYKTRPLNTELSSTTPFELSHNHEFTLPGGTYEISSKAPVNVEKKIHERHSEIVIKKISGASWPKASFLERLKYLFTNRLVK